MIGGNLVKLVTMTCLELTLPSHTPCIFYLHSVQSIEALPTGVCVCCKLFGTEQLNGALAQVIYQGSSDADFGTEDREVSGFETYLYICLVLS